MAFFRKVLKILEISMKTPKSYGWFHLLCLLVMVGAAVLLCTKYRKVPKDGIRKGVMVVAIITILLEVYKQIVFTFDPIKGGISMDYQWYAFPFQFCSTPMYIGLLAGLTRKGKLHDAFCAYLATFAVFAGVCVMLYPGDVFIGTTGINIQTMICHGSMVYVGVYLFASGHVKLEHKTILKAIPVFAVCVTLACIMNEVANLTGLLERETFNMFFISRHCEPSLPVFSLVQKVVPFAVSLVIYIGIFTLAAYLILLASMGFSRIGKKQKVTV